MQLQREEEQDAKSRGGFGVGGQAANTNMFVISLLILLNL
jgi:hypothetical protein